MRGFRGSRGKQNVMAFRHGQSQPHGGHGKSYAFGDQVSSQHGHGNAPRPLPNWLKTPETLAKEREAELASQAAARAEVQQPKPVPSPRAHLTLIQGGKSATQPTAAPKKAPARTTASAKPKSKSKTKTKAKPAATKKAAARPKAKPRRKAA